MNNAVTFEDIKNIMADKMDFGSPVYFMTEHQFNYCLWHLEDYNKTQERAEKAEAENKVLRKYAAHSYDCLYGEIDAQCICGLTNFLNGK